jgi:hypothetical protein
MNGQLPSRPFSKRENSLGDTAAPEYLNLSEYKGKDPIEKRKYFTANDSKEDTQDPVLTFGMGETQANEGIVIKIFLMI